MFSMMSSTSAAWILLFFNGGGESAADTAIFVMGRPFRADDGIAFFTLKKT